MTETPEILCIYHSPCNDGFTAAWIVHQFYAQERNREVELYPTNYGQQPPLELCRGKYVYIVDFSYPAWKLQQITDVAREVIVIDHHKTAQHLLSPELNFPANVDLHIDMEHSGAMLTWQHFYPKVIAPKLVRYVEDRDMWWKNLPHCDDVHYALTSYEADIVIWNILYKRLEDLTEYMVMCDEGAAIRRYTDKWIKDHLVSSAKDILLDGYMIPSINIPGIFASDAAGILATNRPFALAWYTSKSHRRCSLRSNSAYAHHVDVEEIASKFGGGGNKYAAGFSLPITGTKDFTLQST